MLLSPLQEMSNVSFSDIRYKQLECVLQVNSFNDRIRRGIVHAVIILHTNLQGLGRLSQHCQPTTSCIFDTEMLVAPWWAHRVACTLLVEPCCVYFVGFIMVAALYCVHFVSFTVLGAVETPTAKALFRGTQPGDSIAVGGGEKADPNLILCSYLQILHSTGQNLGQGWLCVLGVIGAATNQQG